ncbi:MAG: ECF transporter S component [Tissierellia bacterium]|nr:ECF transporter S component [Tissierellia bacterium]
MNRVNQNSILTTKRLTRIAMLGVIAFILMFFQLPLQFVAPPFIKLDIADMPILIGSFTMGPVCGIMIAALKNILKLLFKGTTTGGVGELSNFIIGSTFAVVSSVIYRRNPTFKSAVIGLFVGVITMTGLAMMSNYFVVFPLYAKLMPMEAIINMGNAITPKITDLWSMMVYSILPFNLIKGFLTAAVTMLIYKKVSPILKDY